MKIVLLTLLALLGTSAFAAKVGDSYNQVIAEKGKPVSQASAGNMRILNYADASIRLKDDVVTEIKWKAGAHAPAAAASHSGWTTNYREALSQAKSEHRNVFLFFTGSDWCPWCQRLDGEVLSTEAFKSYAEKKLILVKVDFPRQLPQSEELQNQNRALQDQYQIQGYPTVIVLNPDGTPVKTLGYRPGGPGPFIAALQSVEP
jgi:thiol:disulfide interchange protein